MLSNIESLSPLMTHFNTMGSSTNDTFNFWLEYCDMVDLLLNFLASERDSNWELHLESFKKMLSYDRAFDHYKYFVWGTIYIVDMLQLPEKHPELHQHFMNGCHTVSRSKKESKFNSVSTDLALEQSLNKDSKTKGGIIGFTQNTDAVEKWTLTSHLRAAVYNNFKNLFENQESTQEKELSPATILASEKAVLRVIEVIKEDFSMPFKISQNKQPLKNIATGAVVKEEFRDDILNSNIIGQDSAISFMRERLEDNSSFWSPIKKLKLKTFSSEDKDINVTLGNRTKVSIKAQQNLFSKLLTVSRHRNIDLPSILKYELSAIPLSLFYPNGTMRKTDKSKLLHELEMKESSMSELPPSSHSATVVDFMALIQIGTSLKPKSFDQLKKFLESSISSAYRESSKVALVPDRYDITLSIKADERSRRSTTKSPEIAIHNESQKLPKDLQNYLSNPKNKVNLVTFLFDLWALHFPSKLKENQVLYLANLDGSITEITSSSSSSSSSKLSWESDHEEADSKMFVLCKYLADEYELDRVIITSPDTDVAVIACYHFVESLSLDEFWMKTGTGSKSRYIPIHKTCSTLGETICKVLPSYHAITGCDSVSSITGFGKKSSFNFLKNNIDAYADMKKFGESCKLDLESEYLENTIKFVCKLYDSSFDSSDINDLRYKLFTKKNKIGEKLPPTLDSLLMHLCRACYQSFIWKSACNPVLALESPIGNGWKEEKETLVPEYMLFDPVPESIIELVSCKCTKGCKQNSCLCRKAKLSCCDACSCNDCENQDEDDEYTSENDTDNDDDF